MIFNTETLKIMQLATIKLSDDVRFKIEDGLKNNNELLVTIDASHYGYLNGNQVIYRHDTVKNDIHTWVYPESKPMIEKHRLDTSLKYGSVIAADYKKTKWYDHFDKLEDLEGLTTEEYMDLCKDILIPFQKKNLSLYDGLGFVQLVVKIDNKQGIQKILDNEFTTVSIGADPKRLICSVCGKDMKKELCKHFFNRKTGNFLLSESLEYEEVSFVDRPADKFGKITRIHDGQQEDFEFDQEELLSAEIDVIKVQDFFQQAEGKTIVCVDNICKIINQEEESMKKIFISLLDEFGEEKVKEVLTGVTLKDSELDISKLKVDFNEETPAKQFAIVQKTEDGDKLRFPLNDEENVLACINLLKDATDLTDQERSKAESKILKAAKKLGIEDQIKVDEEIATEMVAETIQDGTHADTKVALEDEVKSLEANFGSSFEILEKTLKDASEKLKDNYIMEAPEAKSTTGEFVAKIFELLKWFGNDIKWAGEGLSNNINSYLIELGKEAIDKGMKDELQSKVDSAIVLEDANTKLNDEIKNLQEECDALEESNKELNFQLRLNLVDEIVACKIACGILEDEKIETEKQEYMKTSYNVLVSQVSDFRKITAKLKDSVNNNVEVKTIPNPLQDSLENGDNSQVPQPKENVDPKTALKAFRKLFN